MSYVHMWCVSNEDTFQNHAVVLFAIFAHSFSRFFFSQWAQRTSLCLFLLFMYSQTDSMMMRSGLCREHTICCRTFCSSCLWRQFLMADETPSKRPDAKKFHDGEESKTCKSLYSYGASDTQVGKNATDHQRTWYWWQKKNKINLTRSE